MRIFFVSLIGFLLILPLYVFGGSVEVIKEIASKTIQRKILRIDPPEKAPVEGWFQYRVWYKTKFGEVPVLFYATEDGKFFFAGSVFDSAGNNLTKKAVGMLIPRKIELEEMALDDNYMIGSPAAEVKVVLWTDSLYPSLLIWKDFMDIYEKNGDWIALYIKFKPESEMQLRRLIALSCYKNRIAEGMKFLLNASPEWGVREEDLKKFLSTKGFSQCYREDVIKDGNLAKRLDLPKGSVVFINNTLMIKGTLKEALEEIRKNRLR